MHFDEVPIGPLGCLVFRPETRADAPVLIGIHGRGQGPEALTPVCERLGDSFVHVLPRAPNQSWYPGDSSRDEQLAKSRGDLQQLIDALRVKLGNGPEATAVWGFSQGGLLALELGLTAPSALAGIACLSGRLNAYDETTLQRARGRDFLLVHGISDEVVPMTLARDAYRALEAHGARVQLAELPCEHELTATGVATLRGFIGSLLD